MWIAGTVVLLILGAGILIFNRLVRARDLVDDAWSEIETRLNRRYDLIPLFVEILREYSRREPAIFENIARQRSETMNVSAPTIKAETESVLSRQLRILLALAERYPELRADRNFLDLQKSFSEVESQIQYAQRRYNSTVRHYNKLVLSFPYTLLAERMGFHREAFFEIEYAAVAQSNCNA